jgi:hypothetical protein
LTGAPERHSSLTQHSPTQRHTNLNALSALGLLIILLLPLLAGTPVPVSVLMEESWAPWFAAGDVLVASGKVPVSPGHFIMYRDVGTGAALRLGNASTALGLLVELRCGRHGGGNCAGGALGPSTATAFFPLTMRAVGPAPATATEGAATRDVAMPTHVLVLRPSRAARPRDGDPGAPAALCPPSAIALLPPTPPLSSWRAPHGGSDWECAPVPIVAVLSAVAVRVPHAAAPVVPLCAARRGALRQRPPFPRLAPAVGAAWRRSALHAWAVRTVEAARIAREGQAACDALRDAASKAQQAAAAASVWAKRGAEAAAKAAASRASDPGGPCGVAGVR